MVFKNLFRRKGRTFLTISGISIGVMTIITLGTLADGIAAGYASVLGGSDADFVLTDPEAMDIIMSAVDEDIGEELLNMPEVEAVSPMLQGLVTTEEAPYFFVFGYQENSFSLARFQIVEGVALFSREAQKVRGRPMILGMAAAESMKKEVGDSMRMGDSVYRIVGIYETGDAFEEGGAVVGLADAQELLGMPRQVSLFYIQIEDPALVERLQTRVTRLYPELSLSTGAELSDKNIMTESLQISVWSVAALAILIGGVGMMNAQLMSVLERTREIGVLRAVGWQSWRILLMILAETVLVSLLGGLMGVGLAMLTLQAAKNGLSAFGASTAINPDLLLQSFSVVFILGITGGIYPAYRASKLEPIEALRYEGGSMGDKAERLPVGGMAIQNLWRRKARTLLTLGMIGITIGSIMALNLMMDAMSTMLTDFVGGSEIMVRQAGAADTSVAFIDERVGDKIDAMPEVENVSGILFTATMSEELGMFLLQGFNPREAAIQKFQVVEGIPITSNRQIMLGRSYADAQNMGVGDTLVLGETRFQVVGIYESSTAWEEMGGVVTLRDAQNFAGRQRKVTFFAIDLHDPGEAEAVVEQINAAMPEVHATLAGEFANELPDMQNSEVMIGAVAVMAIVVGGVGMMNAMLMAVLERTREIGVLRALGWRRRAILSLIIRESLALGLLGAVAGMLFAGVLILAFSVTPRYGEMIPITWNTRIVLQTIGIALLLGVLGGIYPAFRATRLQPVEALRYE